MKKILIIILLTNYIFCLKVLQHNCVHNKIKQIYKYEALAPLEPVDVRNLGNIQPRNMLISFDMNFFQRLAPSPQTKILIEACSKAMQLAGKYFYELIKIIPKSEQNMRYRQYNPKCGEYPIPQSDKDKGINSDLHIYTQFKIEPAETYLAYASWCQFLDGIGPTHGQVNFNLGILGTKNMQDPVEFEDLMEIVIHEMTHILGFSNNDIPRWVDQQGRPYAKPSNTIIARGTPFLVVQTPHVLNYARKYFNCPNLFGMPLENNGGQGSAGSHWETTVIQNEYMNAAQSPTQAYYSPFTTNLLRDTGFFYEVSTSMEEQTFYGLGEGCNHVFGTCDSSRKEYCRPRIDDGQCDYYHHGSSTCQAGKYMDRGCILQLLILIQNAGILKVI
ncbi:leishmanolysin family protein, putative [Ichthyophthirius multifiliis]|uniref:Leishmanolysin family protein, putative n=1 Tax=Ichthyophthirius multifiliis TaxID=5932 RepID=G0QLE8_ICHMU|nr:leishmanolysin family protein, putative [Ichthyophthirius multifiliis]EGR33955.1 leishmanolysin family protein, putative [Ichthyophthirius multifiliis]|eukprot:XP_004039259.1 leishmanolysin family protein, putative [Ichthyophthirius multifiliis]